jgi:flavin reductase (DIM6/NTAB) family NADH-FMN oxidoreductase RutF
VTVVTTLDEAGQPVGLTANSFSSVSLDPPLILFCLARSSTNVERFRQAEHFAINVLHIGQQPTSGVFARSQADRFQDVAWETWDTGAPILSGALASFECGTEQIVEAGDHLVIIGRVTRARFEPRRDPLLYFRGKYRRLHFS